MGKIAVVVLVAGLVLLIIRGLWRATAVQKGTGCPCCDKVLGHDQDHNHDHAAGQSCGCAPSAGKGPSRKA